MEVDKLADEVTDMEIDKQTDVVMIYNYYEEFIGVTLAIGETYGEDVRGNVLGAGHGG